MSDTTIPSRKTYLFVYLGLILLLSATVGATFLPLGPFHVAAAVGIAIAKAVLVMLFFMHLRYTNSRTILLLFGTIILLLILIGLTSVDYLTRVNWMPLLR
jgi:cytochrome c oxidase subunit 4